MSKERELLRRISSHSESRIPTNFIYEIQELLAQPEEEPSVKLPESEDEAVMMNLLSDNWLRNHAPHRLNQPEQEPVAWMWDEMFCDDWTTVSSVIKPSKSKYVDNVRPLYTAPPEQKPLTPRQGLEEYKRGYARAELDLKREPLSDEEIDIGFQTDTGNYIDETSFIAGVIFAEKAHGITGVGDE